MQKAIQMMIKMGYQPGLGLGKNLQGIIEPVSSIPNNYTGRIYGGSKSPPRIGLGVPSLPGWNGELYGDSMRFLFLIPPRKFVKPVPKKDTSKFICSFSDDD